MPVKKTAAKKTPAKKKPTVQKVDEVTAKVKANTVRTVLRVDYPETTSIVTLFSNMSVDDFINGYSEARAKDDVLEINVGLTKTYGIANYYSDVVHFAKMLIPARYIQSIRGYADEG